MSVSSKWQLDMNSSRLLVAPLLPAWSRGLRDAALLGFPHGLPFLTSSVAAALYGMKPGSDCQVPVDDDSPAKWVNAMLGLLRCEKGTTIDTWDKLSSGGLDWYKRAGVEGETDVRRLTSALHGFVSNKGHKGSQRKGPN